KNCIMALPPKCRSEDQFKANFPQRSCWSPDGLCFSTFSEEKKLFVFETPQSLLLGKKEHNTNDLKPVLTMPEQGSVYDMAWSPAMSSRHPETCLLFSCSRGRPIHAFDAFNGKLISSYCTFDANEETATAFSIGFSPAGDQFVCGHRGFMSKFSVSEPGNKAIKLKLPSQNGKLAKNAISTIAAADASGKIWAVGDYKGKTFIFDEKSGKATIDFDWDTNRNGIWKVDMTDDFSYLLSSARKQSEILMWDCRFAAKPVAWFERPVHTIGNQRMGFCKSTDGKYLFTSSADGIIRKFDLYAAEVCPKPEKCFRTPFEFVNDIDLNKLSENLAVLSVGKRSFGQNEYSSSSDDSSSSKPGISKGNKILTKNGLYIFDFSD
ncbi:Telomerase Cajal body protein 1, partial [Bonamia ostreae]